MEFGQPMRVTLVNVSCKFEMYIFKIAKVINENVRIAFLYVLSIFIYGISIMNLNRKELKTVCCSCFILTG